MNNLNEISQWATMRLNWASGPRPNYHFFGVCSFRFIFKKAHSKLSSFSLSDTHGPGERRREMEFLLLKLEFERKKNSFLFLLY